MGPHASSSLVWGFYDRLVRRCPWPLPPVKRGGTLVVKNNPLKRGENRSCIYNERDVDNVKRQLGLECCYRVQTQG